MKVQIIQDSLSKALTMVSKIVSSKPNLPILGNIYLEAGKEGLLIAATDLEVGMKISLKAEVKEEGTIAVPARLFVDFISTLSPEKVLLETEGLLLKARSGVYSSTFNCLDGDEFPPFPVVGKDWEILLTAKEFKEALGKTLFSASTDLSRQVLTGVLFEFQKKPITLVSTDGFRLSSQILNQKGEGENLIIPARGLQELARNGEIEGNNKKGEIKLALSENKNQIMVRSGSLELALRLLEGKFPDYKKIIPSQFVSILIIDKEEMMKAVKVAAIFARDNANIVHFSLKSEEQSLLISAQAREMGEGSSILHGSVEGDDLSISFNARFLTEILNVLTSPQLKLEFAGSLKPVRISETDNKSFFHILMPVRTGN